MLLRRVVGLSMTCLGVPLLVACGRAGPGPRASSPGKTSTTAAPTTTAPAPSSPTSAAGLAFLTAWGATPAQWNANHAADPGAPGDYWPRLPDNLDTYTNLQVVGGRVLGYVLNLDPSVPLPDAQSRLANDLPLDSAVAGQKTLPASGPPMCNQVIETGPTLRVVDGYGVVVDFESRGSAYDPSSVARIIVSPLGPGRTAPTGC